MYVPNSAQDCHFEVQNFLDLEKIDFKYKKISCHQGLNLRLITVLQFYLVLDTHVLLFVVFAFFVLGSLESLSKLGAVLFLVEPEGTGCCILKSRKIFVWTPLSSIKLSLGSQVFTFFPDPSANYLIFQKILKNLSNNRTILPYWCFCSTWLLKSFQYHIVFLVLECLCLFQVSSLFLRELPNLGMMF